MALYKKNTSKYIHPKVIGLCAILGVVSVFVTSNFTYILSMWILIVLPIFIIRGKTKSHILFIVKMILPLTITLVFVWGYLVGAPPNMQPKSDPIAGINYATLICLRLVLISGIFQLCFTIPPHRITSLLQNWGIGTNGQIITLGAYAVWPEIKLRSEQIITARFARGLVQKRNLITKAKQVPYILIPLLGWILRSSIQREESWSQKELLKTLNNNTAMSMSLSFFDILLIVGACLWLTIGIYITFLV